MKNGKDRHVVTIIGPGVSLEGDLISEEGLRIDGSLKGRIECQNSLIISKTARVQADIIGDDVFIAGEVRGTITGKNIVEVSSSGRIIGDITTANLVMEPGAFFEGKCNMNNHSIDQELLNHNPVTQQPRTFPDVQASA
jgi:cytoskeletal protein CcmA (bactofilin family)